MYTRKFVFLHENAVMARSSTTFEPTPCPKMKGLCVKFRADVTPLNPVLPSAKLAARAELKFSLTEHLGRPECTRKEKGLALAEPIFQKHMSLKLKELVYYSNAEAKKRGGKNKGITENVSENKGDTNLTQIKFTLRPECC